MHFKNIFFCLIGLSMLPSCQNGSEKKEISPIEKRENGSVENLESTWIQQNEELEIKMNPENIKTYKGKILQIYSARDPYSHYDQISFILQTDSGSIPVQLGPGSYVLGGSVMLDPNQEVEVKGFEHYWKGRVFIIAQEVKIKGYKLKLRDKNGNPLWTGWEKG